MSARRNLQSVERIWRRVHHHVFICPQGRPLLLDLLHDLRCAAEAGEYPALCSWLDSIIHDLIPSSARHALLPLLLDPSGFCESHESLPHMADTVQRVAVAFCLLAGAHLCSVDVDKQHIRALHLPCGSRLLRRVYPPPPVCVCDDWYTDSEDELVPPWVLRGDPPAGSARPATQLVDCTLSGPDGLHDAPFVGRA